MDERSARRNQETGCHNGLRGLAASQPRMRADTHDGPEQIAPLQRPDTLMQLSRSSILEVHLVRTAGPYILAHSDALRQRSTSVAFGAKRTLTEPRLQSGFMNMPTPGAMTSAAGYRGDMIRGHQVG